MHDQTRPDPLTEPAEQELRKIREVLPCHPLQGRIHPAHHGIQAAGIGYGTSAGIGYGTTAGIGYRTPVNPETPPVFLLSGAFRA